MVVFFLRVSCQVPGFQIFHMQFSFYLLLTLNSYYFAHLIKQLGHIVATVFFILKCGFGFKRMAAHMT